MAEHVSIPYRGNESQASKWRSDAARRVSIPYIGNERTTFCMLLDNNTTFRECQVLFFKGRAIYLVDSAYIDAIIMEV